MRCSIVGFVGAVALVSAAFAQESTAHFLGIVTDPTGAVIPQASVVARNVATGLERKAATNQAGEYSIPLLPIGEYTLAVEAAGFKTTTLTGLVLQVNQEARVDVKLVLGTSVESVEVNATAPVLVTDASSVGQVVENKSIDDMPLNGRAFWQLAQLTPGAVYTPGGTDITSGGQGIRASRVQLRISGSSRLAGGWFLDGFDITEYEQGSTSITPSTDALDEFKVLAGGMSAEYALPSVINAALKSGQNSFHGSAYEYIRNTDIQARNFFAPTVPPLKRNEFGSTLGGPIKRDKIFFFGDYEGTRVRQGTTQDSTIPTVAKLNGDFSGAPPIFDPLTTAVNPANSSQYIRTQFPGNLIPASRQSPQALYFKSWFPTPNVASNQFAYSPALFLDTDKFDVKVSPHINDRNSIVTRYSFIDNTERDVQGYPVLGYYPLHSRAQNFGVSYLHIFTPNVSAEVSASYYRMYFRFLNASNFNGQDVIAQAGITGFDGEANLQPTAPSLNFSGYTTLAGNTDNRPKQNRIRTWEYRSALTWAHGSHNLKFGAELIHQAHSFLNGNGSQGVFTFNGQYTQNPLSTGNTGDAFADFLLGDPQTVQRSTPQQLFGVTGSFWAFYGQDDYRVSRDLTLNLGLRWELNSFYNPIRGQTNAFDFATGKMIIPTINGTPDLTAQPNETEYWNVFRPLLETTEQLGLPYSIRSADDRCPAPRIGLAWKVMGSEKWVIRSAYGIFYIYPDTNQLQPLYRTPPFNLLQQIANDVPTPTTLVPSRNLTNYFLGQPLASITATPNPTTALKHYRAANTQTWNVNLQHELAKNLSAEIGYVANKGTRLEESSNANIPMPGPGNVQGRRPYPNWGVFLLQQWDGSSTYNSFQAKLEKRFSNGFSILGSYTFSKCLDVPGSEEGAAPAYYLNSLNRGPCSYDTPQNFVTSYIWELPLGKGRKHLSHVPGAVNFFIGGWQWQGINTFQSGVPFSATISTDTANTGATSQRPNAIAPAVLPHNVNCWFFVAADAACHALDPNQANTFVLPATYSYGNAGRDTLRGNRLVQFDTSLFKTFSVTESKSFDFHAQVYNLANTPSFSAPATNVNLATGGLITSTRNEPRVFEFALTFHF